MIQVLFWGGSPNEENDLLCFNAFGVEFDYITFSKNNMVEVVASGTAVIEKSECRIEAGV